MGGEGQAEQAAADKGGAAADKGGGGASEGGGGPSDGAGPPADAPLKSEGGKSGSSSSDQNQPPGDAAEKAADDSQQKVAQPQSFFQVEPEHEDDLADKPKTYFVSELTKDKSPSDFEIGAPESCGSGGKGGIGMTVVWVGRDELSNQRVMHKGRIGPKRCSDCDAVDAGEPGKPNHLADCDIVWTMPTAEEQQLQDEWAESGGEHKEQWQKDLQMMRENDKTRNAEVDAAIAKASGKEETKKQSALIQLADSAEPQPEAEPQAQPEAEPEGKGAPAEGGAPEGGEPEEQAPPEGGEPLPPPPEHAPPAVPRRAMVKRNELRRELSDKEEDLLLSQARHDCDHPFATNSATVLSGPVLVENPQCQVPWKVANVVILDNAEDEYKKYVLSLTEDQIADMLMAEWMRRSPSGDKKQDVGQAMDEIATQQNNPCDGGGGGQLIKSKEDFIEQAHKLSEKTTSALDGLDMGSQVCNYRSFILMVS